MKRTSIMPKSKKGTVAIQSVKGRLRLCWTHDRKRHFLALLLDDTKLNRATAQLIAARIEEDIRTQNFDVSLSKYKPVERRQGEAGALTLLDRFIQVKIGITCRKTIRNYRTIATALTEYLGSDRRVEAKDAIGFLEWYGKRLKPVSLATQHCRLNACWEWGVEQGLVQGNPWKQARKTLPKVPPPQPRPFTAKEVQQILEWFSTNDRARHYYDFVEFRLKTGCRSGEAAGLRWGHLSQDCSAIRISEALTDGVRISTTKTGEAREFQLSSGLQEMLLRRKPPNCKPDDLVFTALRGGGILSSTFAKRYWKPALKELDIPYRKPYATRATFASHALYQGVSPAEVAEITGHSQKVLFENYSGAIRRSKLPDLWE